MNKVFKVIWNHATQSFAVVSEISRAKGKTTSSTNKGNLLSTAVATAALTISLAPTVATASTILGNQATIDNSNATDSVAIGDNLSVQGSKGVAVGLNNTIHVKDANSVAVGTDITIGAADNQPANLYGTHSVAVGTNIDIHTNNTIALGINLSTVSTAGNNVVQKWETDNILFGVDSQITTGHGISFGSNNTVRGQYSTSIGWGNVIEPFGDNSSPTDAVAIGRNVRAGTGPETIAIGTSSVATGPHAIALGADSNSTGRQSVAIGKKSTATGSNATALGHMANASNYWATALGYNTNAGDTAVAVGAEVQASGAKSVAVGHKANASGEASTVVGMESKASGRFATSVGKGNNVTGAWSGAFGVQNTVTGDNTYALGNAITATAPNNVILGSLSSESSATTTNGAPNQINNATVSNVFYDGFAGTASAVVSVGNKEGKVKERQIINVAPGKVSADSTDAINGSQLYMVTKGTLAQIPVAYTDKEGNSLYQKPDGTFVKADGTVVAPAEVINSLKNADGTNTTPTTLANVKGSLAPAYNTGDMEQADNGKLGDTAAAAPTQEATAPSNIGDIYNNAATVGDVLNSGWNIQAGDAKDFVKAYDTVVFANGEGTTVKGENTDGKTTTVKINVDKAKLTVKDGKVTSDKAGDTFATATDVAAAITASELTSSVSTKDTNLSVKGTPTGNNTDYEISLSKDLNVNSVIAGNTKLNNEGVKVGGVTLAATGLNNGGNKITNVAAGEADTDAVNYGQLKAAMANSSKVSVVEGKNIKVTSDDSTGTMVYTIATADDLVVNSVKAGDTTLDTSGVKVGDITVTKDGVKAGDVKVSKNGLDNGGKTISNVANGVKDSDAVNVSQLKQATSKVEGDQGVSVVPSTNADGSTTYTVAAKTDNTTIKIENGKITANTASIAPAGDDGKIQAPSNPSALATAGDVVKAISSAGHLVKSAKNDTQVVSSPNATGMKVKAGDAVTYVAGKNLEVNQSGTTISYGLSKDIDVNSVKVGGVSITQDGINAGNKVISNVAKGVKDTDAVNVSQLKNEIGSVNNTINRLDKKNRAAHAGARAAAGLPQVFTAGKSMVSASAGTFKGEGAIAVGYSRASDNGKLILKLQGDSNTRGDIGGSVGVGYQW
ncbi:hypothetical protein A4G18_08330 [Pasteurellaceae bacterium Pebbles2]|nr:hypothetical protein [Pasteurellaceae bacterium Pebbles2]